MGGDNLSDYVVLDDKGRIISFEYVDDGRNDLLIVGRYASMWKRKLRFVRDPAEIVARELAGD